MSNTRDPIVHAVASLAAAISLLEKTPQAKKAAASDTMFGMMLNDYRAALEHVRTALAPIVGDDSRKAFVRHITQRTDLLPWQIDNVIQTNSDRFALWKAALTWQSTAAPKAALPNSPKHGKSYYDLPRDDRVILNILRRVRAVMMTKKAYNLSGALEIAMVRMRNRADYKEEEYQKARDRIYWFWRNKLGIFDNLFEYIGCERPGSWPSLSSHEQAEVVRATGIDWVLHIEDNIMNGVKREQ